MARLIQYGHSKEELMNSTYAQVNMWLEEHIAIEAEQRRNQMIDIRTAYHASADEFGKAIKALESVL